MNQPTNPLDLEAIEAIATKSSFPYHELGKLLAETIPALTAENRRLREVVTRLKAAAPPPVLTTGEARTLIPEAILRQADGILSDPEGYAKDSRSYNLAAWIRGQWPAIAKTPALSAGEAEAWEVLADMEQGFREGGITDISNETYEHIRTALAALSAPKAPPEPPKGREADFDFWNHLVRQRVWSEKTFGPGSRTKGVVDHIRKELKEIEADPSDLKEWIDVVILALDGAWRSSADAEPSAIIDALVAKQAKNEARSWPDWRTMDPDKAIEHDRTGEVLPPESETAKPIEITKAAIEYVQAERDFLRTQHLPSSERMKAAAEANQCAAWTNLCVAADGWKPVPGDTKDILRRLRLAAIYTVATGGDREAFKALCDEAKTAIDGAGDNIAAPPPAAEPVDGEIDGDTLLRYAGDLARAEKQYREVHDIRGEGHAQTGRAWEIMRQAGDRLRDLIHGRRPSTPLTGDTPVSLVSPAPTEEFLERCRAIVGAVDFFRRLRDDGHPQAAIAEGYVSKVYAGILAMLHPSKPKGAPDDFEYRLDLLLDFVDGARKLLRGDKEGPVLTMGNCDAAREIIRRMRIEPPAPQPIPPQAGGLDAVAEYLREMAKQENPGKGPWRSIGSVSKTHWRLRAQEVIEIASRPGKEAGKP